MSFLLGLDIGTTTTKALLYDPESGRVVKLAARPTPIEHPQDGWSQHDPEHLWLAITECLREVTTVTDDISGLAVSSFGEAGLPVDANGVPLYPIVAWFDQRSSTQADWLSTQLTKQELHAITGQPFNPMSGVIKFLWIREHNPDKMKKMTHWLSVADYMRFRLTGEMVTDYTIASRTMLLDQSNKCWSAKMMALTGLEESRLPRLQPSGTLVGKVTEAASRETGLVAGTPCYLGGHDHLCAALAAGGHHPGVVVDSMGTAESLLFVLDAFRTGQAVVDSGYACYTHTAAGLYVFKAGLNVAGGSIEWLVRQFLPRETSAEELPYAELENEAWEGVGQRVGPLWLPHFLGSVNPETDWYSHAALVGVRMEHRRGDFLRGLLESLAFWVRHNLNEMEALTGQPPSQVILLGGATRLKLLVQLKADILGLPMVVPEIPEAAATGAALLAGLGAGVFASPAEASASLRYNSLFVEPDPARTAWYEPLYQRVYQRLYPDLRQINHALSELAGDTC